MRRKNPSKLKDPDMQGTYPALLRAAKRAREKARATNTPLIIWKNGKVVKKWIK